METTSEQQITAPPAGAPAEEPGTGNLDKVRDILFGTQMRDYERRFSRLEERLARETAELREEVRRRLSAVEEYAKREAEALAQRIRAEHDERSEGIAGQSRELRDLAVFVERKTSTLDDALARAQRELRQQNLELQQQLTDDFHQKIEQVLSRLAQESRELRSDKADRSAIAALLTEMAMRLNNETALPSIEG